MNAGSPCSKAAPRDLFADLALVGRLQLGLPPAAEVALALGRRLAAETGVGAGERAATAGAAPAPSTAAGAAALPLTLDDLLAFLAGGDP